MPAEPVNQHSAAIVDRIVRRTAVGAILLHVCLLVQAWGNWSVVLLLCAGTSAVTGCNIFLVRLSARGAPLETVETLRLIANAGYAMWAGHLTGWSLPNWLFLPFVAVVTPEFDRHAGIRVALYCGVLDAAALFDGAKLAYPLAFSALALACYLSASVRTQAIREMLDASNAQRVELAAAQERLALANARILADVVTLKQAEVELREAQKLEAVGRLASGIAHEINTPVQFVGDSVHFLRQGISDLLALLGVYRPFVRRAIAQPLNESSLVEIQEAERRADLAYLAENLLPAAERVQEGLSRVTSIVQSMREFAHPDRKEKSYADLNRAILATLSIARNEYKYVAELQTDLGELPLVKCFVGELNQVILNLVVNAAHAVSDAEKPAGELGLIRVRSFQDGEEVVLQIVDNGTGIPLEARTRIFEPFFTTKEIGRGTGQGLAIARSVVERHQGTISFESEIGQGTTFTIRIPIERASSDGQPQSVAA